MSNKEDEDDEEEKEEDTLTADGVTAYQREKERVTISLLALVSCQVHAQKSR